MTTLKDCLNEVSENVLEVVDNNQVLIEQLEELKKMYEPENKVYI